MLWLLLGPPWLLCLFIMYVGRGLFRFAVGFGAREFNFKFRFELFSLFLFVCISPPDR